MPLGFSIAASIGAVWLSAALRWRGHTTLCSVVVVGAFNSRAPPCLTMRMEKLYSRCGRDSDVGSKWKGCSSGTDE
jgi:hypothetical protein